LAGVVRAHLDVSGLGGALVAVACLVILLQVGYFAGLACQCFGAASLRAKFQKSLIASSRSLP
jgi:hypothetical protein